MNIEVLKRKMRSESRRLKLEYVDKEKAGKSMVDPKLIKGGNSIRIMREDGMLWKFKYEHGGLPPVLQNKSFTRFEDALHCVTQYFEKSGFKVVEIEDLWDSN